MAVSLGIQIQQIYKDKPLSHQYQSQFDFISQTVVAHDINSASENIFRIYQYCVTHTH